MTSHTTEKKYPICPECGKNTIVLFTKPVKRNGGIEVDWDASHIYCCNAETNCKINTPLVELSTPVTEPRYSLIESELSSSATKIREEERARTKAKIEDMFSEPFLYAQFPAHVVKIVAYDKGGVGFAGREIDIEQCVKDALLPSEGESKAVKRSDISDEEVCRAVAEYKITQGDFPYQTLAKKFDCDEKLAYSACERACDNGLIEYGVSLRTGWLTEKGEALILGDTNTPQGKYR